jgi:hypothetical protein
MRRNEANELASRILLGLDLTHPERWRHHIVSILMEGEPEEQPTPEGRILAISAGIRPKLAGLSPEMQGGVLAELLSMWLAGHYQGGPELMDDLLEMHINMVRGLLPASIAELRARLQ